MQTKWSFDDKLCEEYSYQTLSKYVNLFSSYCQNVENVFWDTVQKFALMASSERMPLKNFCIFFCFVRTHTSLC